MTAAAAEAVTAAVAAKMAAGQSCTGPAFHSLPTHSCVTHLPARPQMSGFGGVVSFEIEGDRQKTSEFVDAVCLPYMG